MFVVLAIVLLVVMVPVAFGLIRASWQMLIYPLRFLASMFSSRSKR